MKNNQDNYFKKIYKYVIIMFFFLENEGRKPEKNKQVHFCTLDCGSHINR